MIQIEKKKKKKRTQNIMKFLNKGMTSFPDTTNCAPFCQELETRLISEKNYYEVFEIKIANEDKATYFPPPHAVRSP